MLRDSLYVENQLEAILTRKNRLQPILDFPKLWSIIPQFSLNTAILSGEARLLQKFDRIDPKDLLIYEAQRRDRSCWIGERARAPRHYSFTFPLKLLVNCASKSHGQKLTQELGSVPTDPMQIIHPAGGYRRSICTEFEQPWDLILHIDGSRAFEFVSGSVGSVIRIQGCLDNRSVVLCLDLRSSASSIELRNSLNRIVSFLSFSLCLSVRNGPLNACLMYNLRFPDNIQTSV